MGRNGLYGFEYAGTPLMAGKSRIDYATRYDGYASYLVRKQDTP